MYEICCGYDFLKTEASGQGHNDVKQYATFHDPKRYPQIKFGIYMSYSIGDMLRTRF